MNTKGNAILCWIDHYVNTNLEWYNHRNFSFIDMYFDAYCGYFQQFYGIKPTRAGFNVWYTTTFPLALRLAQDTPTPDDAN